MYDSNLQELRNEGNTKEVFQMIKSGQVPDSITVKHDDYGNGAGTLVASSEHGSIQIGYNAEEVDWMMYLTRQERRPSITVQKGRVLREIRFDKDSNKYTLSSEKDYQFDALSDAMKALTKPEDSLSELSRLSCQQH